MPRHVLDPEAEEDDEPSRDTRANKIADLRVGDHISVSEDGLVCDNAIVKDIKEVRVRTYTRTYFAPCAVHTPTRTGKIPAAVRQERRPNLHLHDQEG